MRSYHEISQSKRDQMGTRSFHERSRDFRILVTKLISSYALFHVHVQSSRFNSDIIDPGFSANYKCASLA